MSSAVMLRPTVPVSARNCYDHNRYRVSDRDSAVSGRGGKGMTEEQRYRPAVSPRTPQGAPCQEERIIASM